eukprot:88665-Alexandrium_andersonii.AAC.1
MCIRDSRKATCATGKCFQSPTPASCTPVATKTVTVASTKCLPSTSLTARSLGGCAELLARP